MNNPLFCLAMEALHTHVVSSQYIAHDRYGVHVILFRHCLATHKSIPIHMVMKIKVNLCVAKQAPSEIHHELSQTLRPNTQTLFECMCIHLNLHMLE